MDDVKYLIIILSKVRSKWYILQNKIMKVSRLAVLILNY